MRDAADYVPGELEDGPCRPEDHAKARITLEAFKARTRIIGIQAIDGETLLLGNCRCGTTLAIDITKETK